MEDDQALVSIRSMQRQYWALNQYRTRGPDDQCESSTGSWESKDDEEEEDGLVAEHRELHDIRIRNAVAQWKNEKERAFLAERMAGPNFGLRRLPYWARCGYDSEGPPCPKCTRDGRHARWDRGHRLQDCGGENCDFNALTFFSSTFFFISCS